MVDMTNKDTSTQNEKRMTVKVGKRHHTWLMHESVDTEKPLRQIIGELIEAEQARRTQQQPRANGTREDA